IDGKEHSFELNAKVYRQAKELKSDNANLIARVCYLPHTNVVMEVEFLPSMKDCIPEDLPLSPQLPRSWKDFAIQINNNVYQPPLPMSALLADGWTYDDPADSQIILKGVDEWNTYDQENHIALTNDQDQKLSVSVINTARRSEERRVGKECRYRKSAYDEKIKKIDSISRVRKTKEDDYR